MNLNDAIHHVLSGEAVLFTGSGFSLDAINITSNSPKVGSVFASMLYKECGINESDGDLRNAAQIYQEEKGESKLIEVLRNEFTIIGTSEDQDLIASLPWKRIYTTNYDNVLEFAAHKAKKLLSAVTLNDKINQYLDKRTFCVHLNGYIENLTPRTLRKEFKLTNASYLTSDFLQSAWIDLFRHDIQNAKSVFFIGFSCTSDLDISRLISEHTVADNIFFITRCDEPSLSVYKLKRFGNVLNIELKGIAEEIRKAKKNYIDSPKSFSEPRSFYKFTVDYLAPNIKDINILDLFYKGSIREDLIHYSLMNKEKYPYYIFRNQLNEIREYINKGGRNILLHADLGNGKTLFVTGLADCLIKLGYEVYSFKKNYPNTVEEIESLCTYKPKSVIIIENYSRHIDLLQKIFLFRSEETIVIVTERSLINDTYYTYLEKSLFKKPKCYLVKDLNYLSDDEVLQVVKLVNHYGLWGDVAGLSEERRRQIFINRYKGSFRLFLLSLLDSPDIKKRFNDLLVNIKNINDSYFRATLLILASSLFGFDLDLDDLLNILDDELLGNPAFYNNDNLKEIINFSEHKLIVRSSILAESLLVKNTFHNDLVVLLIDVVKKLDTRLYDKNSKAIILSIVSYSRLQTVFNLNENPVYKPTILNFFEEIKTTNYARKNPYFWLQYAIARLSSRDYPIAKQYFDTAYGYAKMDSDFDTYQIDNHYARYMIENEIINGSIESCMDIFIKVHAILSNKNDANSNRHYPLRVAINYGRFYDVYYKNLQDSDKSLFIISCKEILQRVDQYKKAISEKARNRNVYKCEEEMMRILSQEHVEI